MDLAANFVVYNMSGAQNGTHVGVDGGRAMEAAQHEAFERTQSVLDSLDARVMALTKAVKQAQAEREAVDKAIKGLLASDDVSGLDAVDKVCAWELPACARACGCLRVLR